MSLSAGIVGLPNVGKSTLFSSITNVNVEIANYPFATIDANIGIVNVNDKRITDLAKMINPDKVIYPTFKFVDIAGLVKGASKGEGLGNKFLQNIKEVDAICHLIRCFNSKDITHVCNNVDSIRDLEIINLELIYSDLEIISNRINKVKNKANSGDKEAMIEYKLLEKALAHLNNEKLLNTLNLTEEEQKKLKSFSLITLKPIIYIANISEDEINDPFQNNEYKRLHDHLNGEKIYPISAKLEYEISLLSKDEKEMFLKELNLEKSGLDKIIDATYSKLNLATFLTFGKIEVRGWTFKKGMSAPECAGIIHTDFIKKFIKAEIMKYDDMREIRDQSKMQSLGKIKIVGKDYIIEDGDICHFRINN